MAAPQSALPASPVAGRAASRLPWVDTTRTLLIMLVVNIHACVTYSHVGGWYIKEPPEPAIGTKVAFLFWEGHVQSFFMGLLFFISGYFAHFALQRRGPAVFLRERLVRLGVPLVLYVLLIHPFVVWVLNPWGAQFPPLATWYARYLSSGEFAGQTGPLWFVEALLIFAAVLAGIRFFARPSGVPVVKRGPTTITVRRWLGLSLGLGLATFLVRTVQPIGTAVLNLQLCFFPQYIVAFALGVHVAKHGELAAICSGPTARKIGWTALALGPLFLGAVLWSASPIPERGEVPIFGGWHLSALGYALWEQWAGFGLAIGFMALTCRFLNRETTFSRWLSDRSFAVYVIHTPVLVALTLLFRPLTWSPFAEAGLLTVAGIVGSYLVADLLRRVPGVKSVL